MQQKTRRNDGTTAWLMASQGSTKYLPVYDMIPVTRYLGTVATVGIVVENMHLKTESHMYKLSFLYS